jgi:photosystem II stability/assembly factor-like uncharacterized protein
MRQRAFLALLFVASAFGARAGTWTSIGPDGGWVNAIAVDSAATGVVYAATANGVYRSGNRGVTWLRRSNGLGGKNVTSLVVHPTAHLTLYAVTETGAFKTTDGGLAWTRMPIGLPGSTVRDVAVSQTVPIILYATTSGGFFRSTDAGETWSLVSSPQFAPFASLRVDPIMKLTIYAFGSGIIYRSDDGGVSWNLIIEGFGRPAFYAPPQFVSLAIDPSAPSTLYVGIAANSGLGLYPHFGGVYRSTDGGAHWTSASTGLTNRWVSSVALDRASPSALYAAELGGGLFESTDAGSSWTPISGGLPTKTVSCFAQDPFNRSTFYAGTPAGVFRTLDGGLTWVAARSGIRTSDVTSVKIDGQEPPNVFVGGPLRVSPSFDSGVGLFRSPDGGATWTSLGFEDSLVALAVDPGQPGHLVSAATPTGDSLVDPAVASTTFYRSADGGRTWAAGQDMSGTIEVSLAFAGRNSSTVLATTRRVSVIKSVDGGANWFPSGVGFSSAGGTILAHPTDPLILYIGTSQGVYRTTDGGATWSRVFQAYVSSLAIDATSGSTLYAGATGAVYITTDAARTWTAASTGLPSGALVLDIAVDPALQTTAYAATERGVFGTTDLGAHWTAMNDGLPNSRVNAIALDSLSQTLFAGANDSGVYKLALGGSQQGPCPSDSPTLCLNQGRFAVRADWSTTGAGGGAKTLALTDTTGAFWFFSPDNLELVVKVLDGRSINGKFWVFYGSLTNVEFTLTVTDTQTGAVRTYFNPQGQLASVADTSAF